VDPLKERAGLPFRYDIEGLRAIAVLAVMGFHFGFSWLHGGFVGVDIFFVISGYLITGMLVDELKKSHHIDLPRFYGRRARRLLPALLLVTTVTIACGTVILSPTQQFATDRAALASSLYVSNFWFLWQWFDYFAPDNAQNPFLHTWTLSVEEQFYLLWPILLLISCSKSRPRLLAIAIAATTIASFILCLWLTHAKQVWAFYASPARAWEFGLGGLASLAPVTRWARNSNMAPSIGWLGILLLLISFIVIDEDISFPGFVALLPAGATVFVLISGASEKSGGPALVLRTGPFQWFGRLSYSIYLWHWPIIVYALDIYPSLSAWGRLACATLTAVCAAASYRILEYPIRSNAWLAARPTRSIATGAAISVTGVIAASGTAILIHYLASSPAQNLISDVTSRLSTATIQKCLLNFTETKPITCTFGLASSPKTFVLFGDSHADEWSTPLADLADREGWRMLTYLKASCSVADIAIYNIRLHRISSECKNWRSQALDAIIKANPAAVIIAEFSIGYIRGPLSSLGKHAVDLATWASGLERSLRTLHAAGIPIILLRDSPTPGRDMRDCLSYAVWRGLSESRCATSRSAALNITLTNAERTIAGAVPGIRFVDLSSKFCDQTICPAIREGTIVYRDAHHLTTSYAMRLSEPLKAVLLPMMKR
jgi:peptidoglycan/LPS O-acetylase OafA/YrhL